MDMEISMALVNDQRDGIAQGRWARRLLLALTLIVPFVAEGCRGNVEQQQSAYSSDVARAASRLGGAKVFFAHQSVGANIIEGIGRLQKERGDHSLNVIDLGATKSATGGFFAHAYLGENGNPKGKTDAFVSALEGGLGRQVDVAFQKYCFVDIDAQTDVKQLFEYYRQAMSRVHQEFPRLKLVHVTAPLVHVQSGPRAVVKRLIGRTPDHYDDKAARERFNALMRAEYKGREPLFDLAALEASRPGKTPEAFRFRGVDLYELRPEYTTDGAHLNEAAEKRVAAELLTFLSGILPAEDVQLSSAKSH
jgi:hypothetical protein